GVAIATVLGGVVGIVLGAARGAWRAAEPTVELLRAIPPILTFPLFLLALGYGERSRLAAIVFGTTGIILFHVATGLARAPRERAEAVRLAGLRGWDAFAQLHVHEALPALVTGVRVALAAGLVIAVVTEMLIGARHGLGARALDAQLAYRADALWFVILLGGFAGMTMSALVGALGRRLVRWGGAP
ncbi:MAG: ABC transporter permease subunit, partial [Deltaproteobacteria bacterium]|nr:ABC transporter permease subunit [Kofleriaceae bacterium]